MFRFRRQKDVGRNYVNRIVIGVGVGLVKARDVMLSSQVDPQGAMDILATWMGQELAKELLAQKIASPSDDAEHVLEKLLDEIRVAEDLTVDFEGNTAHISVRNCLICPRRVGGYDLEGFTACPVGGIVRGAITTISGKRPLLTRVDLKTAEICRMDVNLSMS
ncbi:MAG: hypothetical protein QXS20_09280 [Candidatus Thorarchaeota archaeon]